MDLIKWVNGEGAEGDLQLLLAGGSNNKKKNFFRRHWGSFIF